MNKCSNEYSMEELLSVVAKLTKKYTSNESTSITYEKARQLMEAVCYCIREGEEGNGLMGQKRLTAEEAYQYGYEKTVQKVKRVQQSYNQMIADFQAYGNENYYDTVTKALPGFFRYYDARFAPQENVISMDYPLLQPIQGMTGIDAIEKYVECISLEQRFLRGLPERWVIRALQAYHEDYRLLFDNICGLVLQYVLGKLLIAEKPDVFWAEETEPYECMCEKIKAKGIDDIQGKFSVILERMVEYGYDNNRDLLEYLESGAEEFSVRLK